MENPHYQLVVAFLKSHPDDAADVLESQSIDDSVTLINALPDNLATSVLMRTLPTYASSLCAAIEAKEAAKLLAPIGVTQIAVILRFTASTVRDALLGALPFETAAACRLLLSYSQNTVGAWMMPQMIMLAEECNVTQALARLSMESTAVDIDAIYVVSRDLKLCGMVNMPVLLRASGEEIISTLMSNQTYAISGRASLNSVQHHAGWTYRDTLPVVNRHHQLIGMLRHVDLRKGLDIHQHSAKETSASNDAPLVDLYHSYGGVLVNLFNVFNDIAGNVKNN